MASSPISENGVSALGRDIGSMGSSSPQEQNDIKETNTKRDRIFFIVMDSCDINCQGVGRGSGENKEV